MVKKIDNKFRSNEFIEAIHSLREGPPPDGEGAYAKPSIRFIAKVLGCTDDRVR